MGNHLGGRSISVGERRTWLKYKRDCDMKAGIPCFFFYKNKNPALQKKIYFEVGQDFWSRVNFIMGIPDTLQYIKNHNSFRET